MDLFRTNKLFFGIIFFYSFKSLLSGSEKDNLSVNLPKDRNQSLVKNEVIRVVQPGVFDYQSNEYVVRLRLWGIGFPERDQPGFNDAISASERLLLGVPIDISVKQEFDSKNLKVVQVHGQIKKMIWVVR